MMTPLLLATLLSTGPDQVPLLETRLRSVALFKNGYAYYVREVSCPPRDEVDLAFVPVPVHGTFWIAADPTRLRIKDAVSRRETWTESMPPLTPGDLLRASVGKELMVRLGRDDTPTRVRVLRVTEPPPPREGAASLAREGLVFLQTPSGELAMSRANMGSVQSAEGPLPDRVEVTREDTRLRLRLEPRDSQPTPLVVSYLAAGATWAPSYVVDISDARLARLTAKAEIFTEEEDLENTTVSLVTGFPNLAYRHLTSPIAGQGTLAEFLRSLFSQDALSADGRNLMQSQLQTQRAMREPGAPSAFPLVDAPAGGDGTEDLFFYERKGVTLKRGERGYYPLFTVSVPYEHLYEWWIPDTLSDRASHGQRERVRTEVVWHSLRLTNNTRHPWTTAPAMTMKGERLLGQDGLGYTAPGARTSLRITQAVDLAPEVDEIEVARARNAVEFHGYRYDLVTLQGELRIHNHKREDVTVEITKMLSGQMVETPAGAEVKVLAKGLREANSRLRLFLKLPVPAGASTVMRYVYRVLVRS